MIWIQITRPKHLGIDRSQVAALLAASLLVPFSQTAAARLLSSYLLASVVLAIFLR